MMASRLEKSIGSEGRSSRKLRSLRERLRFPGSEKPKEKSSGIPLTMMWSDAIPSRLHRCRRSRSLGACASWARTIERRRRFFKSSCMIPRKSTS